MQAAADKDLRHIMGAEGVEEVEESLLVRAGELGGQRPCGFVEVWVDELGVAGCQDQAPALVIRVLDTEVVALLAGDELFVGRVELS